MRERKNKTVKKTSSNGCGDTESVVAAVAGEVKRIITQVLRLYTSVRRWSRFVHQHKFEETIAIHSKRYLKMGVPKYTETLRWPHRNERCYFYSITNFWVFVFNAPYMLIRRMVFFSAF